MVFKYRGAISLGGRTSAERKERRDHSIEVDLGSSAAHTLSYMMIQESWRAEPSVEINQGGGGKEVFAEVSVSMVSVDCILT